MTAKRPPAAAPRQFINRHASALRALLAYGLAASAATELIDQAKAAGRDEIDLLVPVGAGAGAEAGQLLVLKRMRGGHVDVFRLVGKKATR